MRHRIRQFAEAGRLPTGEDLAFAREYLGGELLRLFLAQHPRDIVHGAATARWLVGRGHEERDLVVAGFVHDVGKGQQRRWDRAAYVVCASLGVAGLAGDADSRFETRRALERTYRHSWRGAELLRRAGATPRVIDLTLRHHGPHRDDGVLALLQEADEAS